MFKKKKNHEKQMAEELQVKKIMLFQMAKQPYLQKKKVKQKAKIKLIPQKLQNIIVKNFIINV